MITEKGLLEMLSNSEQMIYDYIKEQADENGGSFAESMENIGINASKSHGLEKKFSMATVHRAMRKLRKQGIIGIVPPRGKAEPNEIVYYGIPDPTQQVGDIFAMIQELSTSARRFEAILQAKDRHIEQLKRDKELLYEQIDRLETQAQRGMPFDPNRIISMTSLEDGTTAYLVKDNQGSETH